MRPTTATTTRSKAPGWSTSPPTGAGIICVNAVCAPRARITDGRSNTFLISEDAGRPDTWRNGKLTTPNGQASGAGWADDAAEYITHGAVADGSKQPGPCHSNCTNENEVYSFHNTAVANHVFADGSVHFIGQAMIHETLRAARSPRPAARIPPAERDY